MITRTSKVIVNVNNCAALDSTDNDTVFFFPNSQFTLHDHTQSGCVANKLVDQSLEFTVLSRKSRGLHGADMKFADTGNLL